MTINEQYSQARDIVLNHLQDNKITKVYETHNGIDVFILAKEFGFDVRGAFFKNKNVGCCLLVNEEFDYIEGFTSNKVITYSNEMSLNDIIYAVAFELGNYFLTKQTYEDEPIVYGDTFYPGKSNKRYIANFIASAIISPLTYLDSDIEIIDNSPVKKLKSN